MKVRRESRRRLRLVAHRLGKEQLGRWLTFGVKGVYVHSSGVSWRWLVYPEDPRNLDTTPMQQLLEPPWLDRTQIPDAANAFDLRFEAAIDIEELVRGGYYRDLRAGYLSVLGSETIQHMFVNTQAMLEALNGQTDPEEGEQGGPRALPAALAEDAGVL